MPLRSIFANASKSFKLNIATYERRVASSSTCRETHKQCPRWHVQKKHPDDGFSQPRTRLFGSITSQGLKLAGGGDLDFVRSFARPRPSVRVRLTRKSRMRNGRIRSWRIFTHEAESANKIVDQGRRLPVWLRDFDQ